jgi:predicted nucleic acid-binding protein
MSKKFYLDTNILLSLLLERDDNQKECLKLVEKIKQNKINAVTGNIVLAELVWVLKSYYGIPKKEISEKLLGITRLRGLKIIDDYDLSRAIDIYEKKSVKYIDALIASIKLVNLKKWVVVSFDKDFDKIGVLRKEPADI